MEAKYTFFKDIKVGEKFFYGNDSAEYVKTSQFIAKTIGEDGKLLLPKIFSDWYVVELKGDKC